MGSTPTDRSSPSGAPPDGSARPPDGPAPSGGAAPSDGSAGTEPSSGPRPGARRTPPVRKATVLAVATGVVGVAAILLGWVLPLLGQSDENEPTARITPAQTVSPRDDSAFEGDVTFPDGSVVERGTAFDKVWRIRNAGTVPWHDRYLTRMNDTPCKAPERVGIGPVLPGETVDITVRVRAADSPGRCKIFWKMTDEDGTPLLAGKRPIFLDVTVG
ncbi:hypothetical protein E1292_19710 [Nonomuraea deserti]|uniref:Nbr1 FW domain-containing protein n=1 Tax=Nonomuraea deserti TaxID=1848322 RepID=A0A4V2YAJ7_9ACTN|nr:hypothetical protein E1292_19710 [Nonomuraea deserti]